MTYAASDAGSSDLGFDLLMDPRKTSGDGDAYPSLEPLVEASEESDAGSDGPSDDSASRDDPREDDARSESDVSDLSLAQDGAFDQLGSPPQRPGPPPAQAPAPPKPPQPPRATEGYNVPAGATQNEVKRDLLYQFDRLEKKGYKMNRRFSMASSVEDMRAEYDRIVRDKRVDASVRFQQTCLMGLVTGAELLNNKFDPFDLRLDGWSESLHGKMNDFDDTFEELAVKYSGRGQMAPEIKLVLSVVGSAFMFHMTKKLTDDMPGLAAVFGANPDLQKSVAGAAANMMNAEGGGGAAGGLAGLFGGMFGGGGGGGGGNPGAPAPMRGPAPGPPPAPGAPAYPQAATAQAARPQTATGPPQTPRAPPQQAGSRASASEVLNFMKGRAAPGSTNIEVLSQSDASEISEIASASSRNKKNRRTLAL